MKKVIATAILALSVTGAVATSATAAEFNDYFAEQALNGR